MVTVVMVMIITYFVTHASCPIAVLSPQGRKSCYLRPWINIFPVLFSKNYKFCHHIIRKIIFCIFPLLYFRSSSMCSKVKGARTMWKSEDNYFHWRYWLSNPALVLIILVTITTILTIFITTYITIFITIINTATIASFMKWRVDQTHQLWSIITASITISMIWTTAKPIKVKS